ncbi:uncharacterized protein EV154DRAFT_281422 [Mucor mucedo]|uniref:uncharacterized protein n=1 Tax=Mucor mucedo TaxID=29922 RepID=UPI002220A4BD|nr:uncharacterized protein EV154DRAFT_281422 [Mucor mucedo]KAI7896138.1 hypothetical protein EV154DRAFT_281422 [Mucor mucedo]
MNSYFGAFYRHSWSIDKCIPYSGSHSYDDDDFYNKAAAEERRRIIELSLKGYNTACLFINKGGDYYSFKRRMDEQELLFKELNRQIMPNTTIEYVYFCMFDSSCCDLYSETPQSNIHVLEKGLNYWMRKADSVMDIWKMMRNGTKFPHVVRIRLIDPVTNRPGYLNLFDLLNPMFSPQESKLVFSVQESFQNLRKLVNLIVTSNRVKNDYVPINCVLTKLLLPFLLGQGNLVVYALINECPKNLQAETVLTLDFITQLRNIKSYQLPNEPLSDETAKFSVYNHTLQILKWRSKKIT